MVLDRLAQRWGILLSGQKRLQGRYGEGRGPRGQLRLLRPETYMNRSGQSVRATLDWFKLPPESVLVIYDDMDIPLGRLRLRASGSAGGHNGIKSLIQHLGTQTFPRLRVGVGRPAGLKGTVGHVLGGFSPEERPCLEQVLEHSADSVELMLRQTFQTAMNRYNPMQICESLGGADKDERSI